MPTAIGIAVGHDRPEFNFGYFINNALVHIDAVGRERVRNDSYPANMRRAIGENAAA